VAVDWRNNQTRKTQMNDATTLTSVTTALLVLGYVAKNHTKLSNDKIPLLLLPLGTVLHIVFSKAGWQDPSVWLNAFVWSAGATGLHQAAKAAGATVKPNQTGLPLILLLVAVVALTGCTTINTKPIDDRNPGIVTTVTRATSIFAGKQALAGLKSSQTEKTQFTTLEGVSQEGGEQLNQLIQGVAAGVVAGLKAGAP